MKKKKEKGESSSSGDNSELVRRHSSPELLPQKKIESELPSFNNLNEKGDGEVIKATQKKFEIFPSKIESPNYSNSIQRKKTPLIEDE